jgi:Tfp pilus assembly protein PilO
VDRNRIKMFAALATAVVVVALGFLLGVQPQLSAATAAKEQQVTVESQNAAISAAIAELRTENEGLPALRSRLADLQAAVPPTASLPSFITDVGTLAEGASVTVTDLTLGDAQAYTPPEAPATDVESVDADGAETTPETSSGETPEAEAPGVVTDPAVTAANFSSVPVSITIEGSYAAALSFVSAMQGGDRLFALSAFASAGSSVGGAEGSVGEPDSWTVTGNVFVLLDAASTPTDATTTPTAQAEGDADGGTAAGE